MQLRLEWGCYEMIQAVSIRLTGHLGIVKTPRRTNGRWVGCREPFTSVSLVLASLASIGCACLKEIEIRLEIVRLCAGNSRTRRTMVLWWFAENW